MQCTAVKFTELFDKIDCDREHDHDGPHTGVDGYERVQWKHDETQPVPESEQTANTWSMLLPPMGTPVRVFGVDGRWYFGGNSCVLEAALFTDDGIAALRLRLEDELCIAPWARVDSLEWRVDA